MARTFDYSALIDPVTGADIDAYKRTVARTNYTTTIALSVVVLVLFLIVLAVFASLRSMMIGEGFEAAGFLYLPFMPIVILAVLGLIIWWSSRWSLRRRVKLYKFALQNDMALISDIPDPGYEGMIFDNGDSRRINDALLLRDGVEIGNYTYVTGSGKHRQTHTWAYAKVPLVRHLPNMVLDAKANNFWKFSNLSDTFDRSQTLRLEGDFNNYFTLYAPKQYERDALYVFTPDVMAVMVDQGKGYDIEIVDNYLYVYSDTHFPLDKPEFYGRIFAIIDTIRSELVDQSDRYADERIGNRMADVVAPEGQRLKPGFNWLIVIIVIIIIYFNVIQPLVFGR